MSESTSICPFQQGKNLTKYRSGSFFMAHLDLTYLGLIVPVLPG